MGLETKDDIWKEKDGISNVLAIAIDFPFQAKLSFRSLELSP